MLRFALHHLSMKTFAFWALGFGMVQTAYAGPLTDWLFGQYRQPPAYPVGPSYYIAPGTPQPPGAIPYAANYSNYTPQFPSTLPLGSGSYSTPNTYLPSTNPPSTYLPSSYTTPYAPPLTSSVAGPYANPYTTQYAPQPAPQYAPQVAPIPAPNLQGGPVLGGVTPSIVNTPIQTTGPYPVTGINQMQPAFLPNAGYATQYNRAAVTYYRPVTQLDPTTGTTVTRMMPCTSYELQAQRQPILTMRPALFGNYPNYRWPSLAAPVAGNSPSYYTAPAYNTTPVPSNTLQTTVQMMPTTGAPVLAPGQYYSGYSPAPVATYPTLPATSNAIYNAYPSTSGGIVPATTYAQPSYSAPAPATYTQPLSSSIVPGTSPTTTGEWRRVDDGSLWNPSGSAVTQPVVPNPQPESRSSTDPEASVIPTLPKQSSLPSMPLPSTFGSPTSNPALPSAPGPTSVAVTRENANAEPTFGLKQLESSRIAEEPTPPTQANHQLLTPPSTLAPEPRTSTATGFESIQPIQGPSTAPAPKWNQGLMDLRDRTAAQKQAVGAPQPKAEASADPAIRWISTERDRLASSPSTKLLQQPAPRIRPSTAK